MRLAVNGKLMFDLLTVVEMAALVAHDLVGFVSLAGKQHDVARTGQHRRRANRFAAVGDAQVAGFGGQAATISSRIDSGSSCRGLSEVKMAVAAYFTAIAAISGRLVRSRSPPQPQTAMSCPPPVSSSPSVRNTFSNASGVWA